MRLGPGPVFVYEWLTAARRWQPYAMRAGFVGRDPGRDGDRPERPSHARPRPAGLAPRPGRDRRADYRTIAAIELTLILLAAPAATAGAVCLDKARGTLDHMLATDLSNAEIVLGKLGVRLIPVLGLIACRAARRGARRACWAGSIPLALIGSFLVAIGCAFVACSLAMTLSVYGRKTHEVLIMTYMIIIALDHVPGARGHRARGPGGNAAPASAARGGGANLWTILHDCAEWSNPFILAMAPYQTPGKVGMGTYLGFLAGCLAISAGLTGLATARIRGVALRQAGRPAGRSGLADSPAPPAPPGCRGCPARRWTSTRWPGGSGTACGRR